MRFPGHNYLGPGNNLNIGDPIDEDDLIALLHDLRYEHAESEEDIINADLDAIDEFLVDFHINNNYHSLIGAVGLSFKNIFEQLFGVVYPMVGGVTKKKLNRGNYLYAYINSKVAHEYRLLRDTSGITYKEFLKSDHYKHIKKQARIDFDHEYPPGTTFDSPGDNDGGANDDQSGIETSRDDNVVDNASSDIVDSEIYNEDDVIPETQVQEPGTSNQHSGELLGDRNRSSLKRIRERNQAQFDSEAKRPAMEAPVESMDTTENVKSGGGGAVSTSTGMNGAMVSIPRCMNETSFTLTFRKSWIFYSYGYNWNVLKVPLPNDQNNGFQYQCTSLATIPCDLIAFYINKGEYDSIPSGSKIVNVKCNVTPLGVRTAFDHGTTLTGTANTEHVPIIMTNVGMNTKIMSFSASSYSVNATKPMIPTGISQISSSSVVEKLYGAANFQDNAMNMSLGLPRSAPCYYAIIGNIDASLNTAGFPNLIQYCDRHLLHSVIGQPIISWSYSPKRGYIGKAKDIYLPNGKKGQNISTIRPTMLSPQSLIGDPQGLASIALQSQVCRFGYEEHHWNALIEDLYVENSGVTTSNMPHVIPKCYIGILPTPSLNPGTETENIQNTSLYFSVETEMTISCDFSSPWQSKGNVYDASHIPIQFGRTEGWAKDESFGGWYMKNGLAKEGKNMPTGSTHLQQKHLRNRIVEY
ncbi:uncharacterized protein [Onthophagus taurus]|uniref:uncharacterized protein n=1 Tax=Onthophagus taurus TaxID=166361 RepID=UPI0039BE1ACB